MFMGFNMSEIGCFVYATREPWRGVAWRGVGNAGTISRTRQARDCYLNFPPIISVRSQKAPTEKCHLVLSRFKPEQNRSDPCSVGVGALNLTHGYYGKAQDRELQRPDVAFNKNMHNDYK